MSERVKFNQLPTPSPSNLPPCRFVKQSREHVLCRASWLQACNWRALTASAFFDSLARGIFSQMEQWRRRIEGETDWRERIGDIPTPKGHNDKQEEPVRDRDRVRERQFVGVSLRTGFPVKISASELWFLPVRREVCIHMCIYVCANIFWSSYICVSTYIYMYTYVHIYICIYICICIYR